MVFFITDITEVKTDGHDVRWSDPVRMRLQKVRHEFFNFDGIPFMCIANMAMNCQFGHSESQQAYQRRTAKRVNFICFVWVLLFFIYT